MAIKDGLIDSIHSWGDFNDAPPEQHILKKLAKRLTGSLRADDLQVKVWINHGTPNNYQNLKARMGLSYKGDDPKSRYYTVDLVKELGIKYYWWSELLPWPLSGNFRIQLPTFWFRLIVNYLMNAVKLAIKKRYLVKTADQLMELAVPNVLGDGTRLLGFTRFCFPPESAATPATRYTIRHSLSSKILDNLIKLEGYLILYTHFGRPRKINNELFQEQDRIALIDLADRYHSGTIWVARTVDLLTYWMVNHFLEWKTYTKGDKLIIELEGLNDPTTGPRLPTEDELAGLCFYSTRPKDTIIRLNGRELHTRVNLPDHTKQGSIGFPVAPAPGTDLVDE
jgi:hypothetical protein